MEVAGQEHPTAQLGGEESELAVSSAKPGPPSGQACSPALTAPAHTRSGRVRRGGQPRSHPQHRFQTPAPSPISSKHPPCAARASQHRTNPFPSPRLAWPLHAPTTYLYTLSPAIVLGGFRIHVAVPSHPLLSQQLMPSFLAVFYFTLLQLPTPKGAPRTWSLPQNPARLDSCLSAHPITVTRTPARTHHSSPFSFSLESMDHDVSGSYKHPWPYALLTPPGKKPTQWEPNYSPSLNIHPDRCAALGGRSCTSGWLHSLELTKFKRPTSPPSKTLSLRHSFSTPQRPFPNFPKRLKTIYLSAPRTGFPLNRKMKKKKNIKPAERNSLNFTLSNLQT